MTDLFDGIFATARIRLFFFLFFILLFLFLLYSNSFYSPYSLPLMNVSIDFTCEYSKKHTSLHHTIPSAFRKKQTSLIEFRSDKFWWSAHILVSESSFKWHISMFKFSSEIQLVCDGRTVGRTDRRTDGRTDEHTFLLRLENASTQEGKDNE